MLNLYQVDSYSVYNIELFDEQYSLTMPVKGENIVTFFDDCEVSTIFDHVDVFSRLFHRLLLVRFE